MRFGWVIMLGVGLASGVAEGGENLVSGRWRSIGRTDETTTSTCLTTPKTPLCVVESRTACVVRRTREICALGTPDGVDREWYYKTVRKFSTVRVFYKVVYYFPPGDKAPKRTLDDFGGEWKSPKPGDAVIGIVEVECLPHDEDMFCLLPSGRESALPELDADDQDRQIIYHLLRRSGHGWRLVDFYYSRLD